MPLLKHLIALLLLLPSLTLANTPDVKTLEKQLSELSNRETLTQSQTRDKQALESALRFANEKARIEQRLETLEKRIGQARSERNQVEQTLNSRQPADASALQQRFVTLEIRELIRQLTDTLTDLENKQEALASVSSELVNFQTLPERAQTILARDLNRSEVLRQQIANSSSRDSTQSEAEHAALQLELDATSKRMELSRRELWSTDSLRLLAEARQQLLTEQITDAELQLNLLQEQINYKRRTRTEQLIQDALSQLPEHFSASPILNQAMQENNELADELMAMTESTNALIRDNVRIENTLDRTRQALRSLNEQIEMLQGSMLLSRIVYAQQASMQRVIFVQGLEQRIADLRLRQFSIHEQRQALRDTEGYIANLLTDKDEQPSEETLAGLNSISAIRADLLRQLDDEISRQLNLSISIHLNQQQLEATHRSLRNTVSEQSFWMPSNHALDMDWVRSLPAAILKQGSSLPVASIARDLTDTLGRNFWLLTPFAFIALLLITRRTKIKTSLIQINSKIGRVRSDSQKHTPVALFYGLLLDLPVPLALAGLALVFNQHEGSYQQIASLTALRIAVVWLVFSWCFRVLAKDGIGERHFHWPAENVALLRRRILAIGMVILLLLPATTVGEHWPERLAEDRIGLLIFIAAMLCLTFLLHRLAMAWPFAQRGQLLQQAIAYTFATLPLALLALAMAGYYYTSVKVAGRLLDSFYLMLLWLLLQASAVRGLSVAARRLAFNRALAKRNARLEARGHEEATDSSEAIEQSELAVEDINLQSLRLIRIGLLALFGTALYLVWSDLLGTFGYMDSVVLWESISGSGDSLQVSRTSLGDLTSALAIILVAVLLIRNLSGLLEVLLFARLSLATGSSYTITTLLKYIIFSVAVVSTLGALGFEWNKLQWLIAALGVGLGFGLQEIFANFVSGLIILFERPIRIGDTITVGELSGTVSKIRIRATTIVDFDRKEIIVPNKTFVTDQLVNWTLTDPVTRITIKVGFAYGSDLEKARRILLQAAKENPRVMPDPAPQILFIAFGASTLDHEMRVHVRELEDRLKGLDELNRRVDALCKEHGLEIAFNQLDVHLINNQGDSTCISSEKK
ncbi:mechanosensitive channel MscK [Alcanivorax sp. 1008]|uniref:mechanosensitive channel MscK n=1 Tax=Alcanivorax sp. 1008 TaxID=2816853 RepID=UPI001DE7C633|nr:mechanosensitive channel MscK [Alcanivorax sp. 1008]MCC1495493.1 mechanosensitive channel MscK [Alcanivorax sp. 1008]